MRPKKKYLVETTTGANVYHATDPDDALRLATRHEMFTRIVAQKPHLDGDQAIKEATDKTDDGHQMPGFRINRVTEVKPCEQRR